MGKYGAVHMCFQPTGEVGFAVGSKGVIVFTATPNRSEAKQYADNKRAEYLNEFISGDMSAEVNDMLQSNRAKFYGASLVGNKITYKDTDIPPHGKLAIYRILKDTDTGVITYETHGFPDVVTKGKPATDMKTKGESTEFVNEKLEMKYYSDNNHEYEYEELLSDEASAIAWVENFTGIATAFTVNILSHGTGSVSPAQIAVVKSGEDFVLTITGTATSLLDNDVEKVSSISNGTYTIADIAADHDLYVAF